jgi:hypothetical protein
MEITRAQMTNTAANARPGFGPANEFHHLRGFPPADMKVVVRPNFDTLYSSAWLDLTNEPVVLSVPDTGGRYYLLPILDMWTDVFAAPGKRTTGTAAGHYAIVLAGWSGQLPGGVERIESPTELAWVIGRTQCNGPDDYATVNAIQDGFVVTPLSRFGQPAVAAEASVDPSVDMATPSLDQVNGMSGREYFTLGAQLMARHNPHVTDWSTIVRIGEIGLDGSGGFKYDALDPDVRAAVDAAPAQALQLMAAALPRFSRNVNGWEMNTDSIGVYGNFYLKRAVVAMVGLGANQPEDAIYPLIGADSDGAPLNGDHDYVLHFSREELPPVSAFWSVTMYDAEGFQAANPINRFAIGDRDDLRYNADGSLDLYLQNDSPGSDLESNWLPAPRGPLGVTMRLYAPMPEALDGRWAPPPTKRVR